MATPRLLTDSLGQYFTLPAGCEFAEPERELTLQKVGETIAIFPTPHTRDEVLAILDSQPKPFRAASRSKFAKLLRRG